MKLNRMCGCEYMRVCVRVCGEKARRFLKRNKRRVVMWTPVVKFLTVLAGKRRLSLSLSSFAIPSLADPTLAF